MIQERPVGAPPVPAPPLGRAPACHPYDEFVHRAKRHGVLHTGHHNENHVLPLTEPMARWARRDPGTPAMVRCPVPGALPLVVRTWNEAEILRAVKGILPGAPECLAQRNGSVVLSYVDGRPLSDLCGNGKPVESLLIGSLMDLVAQMAQVRKEALPPLPAGRGSSDKDSQGFLRMLVQLTDQQIRRPNWARNGGLFAALGIPEDALSRLAERVPAMARRPYSLLHTDLHRDNLIETDGEHPLVCVDWELATYGDPLHELATHLVRMRYPSSQRDEVIEAWAGAMERCRPAAVNGLSKDLRHYVAFELAQSVYPDVLRAALSLGESLDEERLDKATLSVRDALRAAAGPLAIARVPSDAEIGRVLFRWQASRRDRVTGVQHVTALGWRPDERVPESADFPRALVLGALIAESEAPADRVFKGTAHLNSVVQVAGVESPVVVRRRLASVSRLEPSLLSEHAVLRAIERSRVEVSAPRVLALGTSHRQDPFAIHTYVGPPTGDRPPSHPVHGLLPHEADGLVDQLCALTRVDVAELFPKTGVPNFYGWLSDQLVSLVGALPDESRQLAKALGLPDAGRLSQIVSRHRVTARDPALLHGDLNPWNLVRRGRGDSDRGLPALTIIDWEMAVVGDPLYDLVRHMHLTPTRPEIRERLFRRWERTLPASHTKDWQQDWRVYRWIELIRSAYVDLDRLVTGAGMDAPNVRRAVDSYAMTLAAATASLGLSGRSASRQLDHALPRRERGNGRTGLPPTCGALPAA